MNKSLSFLSSQEALQVVKSGHRVFIQGSAATPLHLVRALTERAPELRNVELVSISTFGDDLFADPSLGESFFFNSLFVSSNVRHWVNGPHGDYVPVFLSEIPRLFDRGLLPVDVALIHVSPPDLHGFCSLGVSVDIVRSALRSAKYIIAQVNPQMPRTLGDGILHLSQIDALVDVNEALPEVNYAAEFSPEALAIGRHCAELIEDRSCLQMGIGTIPDAVLSCLGGHKDLGIHTEMFSDGILPLVEAGVITDKYKKKHRGKMVTGFAAGTRRLYDFVHDNPQVAFLDIDYVNDSAVIRANPKVVSINSAVEIDLTGQVCSDSIGMYQYSGVGGQLDFMRGASLSEGGKPIMAMLSATAKGDSKIVPHLKTGAGVITTRAHMHYVVTEYGVADLYGKNFFQRACALVRIAHPDYRESLNREVFARFGRACG
jgi:acyl-CoA hydrolase